MVAPFLPLVVGTIFIFAVITTLVFFVTGTGGIPKVPIPSSKRRGSLDPNQRAKSRAVIRDLKRAENCSRELLRNQKRAARAARAESEALDIFADSDSDTPISPVVDSGDDADADASLRVTVPVTGPAGSSPPDNRVFPSAAAGGASDSDSSNLLRVDGPSVGAASASRPITPRDVPIPHQDSLRVNANATSRSVLANVDPDLAEKLDKNAASLRASQKAIFSHAKEYVVGGKRRGHARRKRRKKRRRLGTKRSKHLHRRSRSRGYKTSPAAIIPAEVPSGLLISLTSPDAKLQTAPAAKTREAVPEAEEEEEEEGEIEDEIDTFELGFSTEDDPSEDLELSDEIDTENLVFSGVGKMVDDDDDTAPAEREKGLEEVRIVDSEESAPQEFEHVVDVPAAAEDVGAAGQPEEDVSAMDTSTTTEGIKVPPERGAFHKDMGYQLTPKTILAGILGQQFGASPQAIAAAHSVNPAASDSGSPGVVISQGDSSASVSEGVSADVESPGMDAVGLHTEGIDTISPIAVVEDSPIAVVEEGTERTTVVTSPIVTGWEGQIAQVVMPPEPSPEDEKPFADVLTVSEGDKVEVLLIDGFDWLFCRMEDGTEGHLPMGVLKKVPKDEK